MAKRSKNTDRRIEGILTLVGALALLILGSSGFRQLISDLGMVVLWILGIGVVGLLGFLVVRKLVKNSSSSAWNLGSRRTLREARPLRSYDLASLELLQTKSTEKPQAKPTPAADDSRFRPKVPVPPAKPPAAADDTRFRPQVWASPSPIIVPAPTPPMAPLKPPALSKADLLDGLRAMDWFQFEKVVARLYEKQGYRVNRRGGANPDGGIDMVIEKPGIQRAVQCKQWKTWNVGAPAVRNFVGALHIEKFQKGIFVTLRGYTVQAKQLADDQGIEMLDADDLARKLESVDARHDPEILALLADERKFCPKCEAQMVLRTVKNGANAGGHFWGCSTYPRCSYRLQSD